MSCPMASDKKCLLFDFARNVETAEFYLDRIPKYTSLVLSTLPDQQLKYFKIENGALLAHERCENEGEPDINKPTLEILPTETVSLQDPKQCLSPASIDFEKMLTEDVSSQ